MDIKCPFLWNHQTVETTGATRPCCNAIYPDSETREEWKALRFKLGIDTPVHDAARKDFENGIWPKFCGICQSKEEKGIYSHRQSAIARFGMPDKAQIKYLDIKFSNTCNLACRMCKPADSSLVGNAIQQLPENEIPNHTRLDSFDPPMYKLQSEDKVKYTKKLIHDGLEVLKVTGGEPFACKYFLEVLDFIDVTDKAKDIEIDLTTNLTKINKSLLRKLEKFKKATIVISVDGYEKIYEYIRQGTTWDNFKKNIELLAEFSQKSNGNWRVLSHFTLQFFNVLDAPNIMNYMYDYHIPLNIQTTFRPLTSELHYTTVNQEINTQLKKQVNSLKDFAIYNNPKFNLTWIEKEFIQHHWKTAKQNLETAANKQLTPERFDNLYKTICTQDKMYDKKYFDYLHPLQIELIKKIERNQV